MNLTLTDEQVSELLSGEVEAKVTAVRNTYIKELIKVQQQLTSTLNVINSLLEGVEVVETVKQSAKTKVTDEQFIELFKSGKTNASIAKETGYNAAYISGKKGKLMK